jgi:hypothetical protein
MPRKDPEAYREYQKQLMKERRARAKHSEAAIPSESVDSHPTVIPDVATPSGLASPNSLPVPATQEVKKPDYWPPSPEERTGKYPTKSGASNLVEAQDVARKTQELFDRQGWALWKCDLLNDEIIVVLRDESVKNYPQGYPVYLSSELDTIINLSDKTIRMIHSTKKQALCQVLPGFEKSFVGG